MNGWLSRKTTEKIITMLVDEKMTEQTNESV